MGLFPTNSKLGKEKERKGKEMERKGKERKRKRKEKESYVYIRFGWWFVSIFLR